MTILKIIFFIFLILGLFLFLTRKFVNPYKLIFVFGKKGSGKSTLLQKLTNRYLKKGWTVYSTEVPHDKYFDFTKVPEQGTLNYIDPRHIFEYTFPENTCILIDEVSLIWHNRDFKHMDKRVIEWFRYQRHARCRVYMFSQTFDTDKVLRELADEMFLVEKFARVFVIARRIIRKPVVVHPGPESPARIDDDMIVDGPLMALFGGREYCFIPYWARKFDSYTTDYKRKEDSEAQ